MALLCDRKWQAQEFVVKIYCIMAIHVSRGYRHYTKKS